MKEFQTEHYHFFFKENSRAEADILQIAEAQEAVYERITGILGVQFPMKIHYYLCQSPDEVGERYGDNEPCNGFARYPNEVFAVYNEKIKCIGAHEDTHLISNQINHPQCAFLREGLAMKADGVWWGIPNILWCNFFLENRLYVSVGKLFEDDAFYSYGDEITYPIAGAFVEWFIQTYSQETFLQLYKQKENYVKCLEESVGESIDIVEKRFVRYIQSIHVSKEMLKKMELERSR